MPRCEPTAGRELAGLHRAGHDHGDGMQSAAGVAAERRKQGGAVLARAIVTAIAEQCMRPAAIALLPAASSVTPVRRRQQHPHAAAIATQNVFGRAELLAQH